LAKYCAGGKKYNAPPYLLVAPKCESYVKLGVFYISAKPTMNRTRFIFISSEIRQAFNTKYKIKRKGGEYTTSNNCKKCESNSMLITKIKEVNNIVSKK